MRIGVILPVAATLLAAVLTAIFGPGIARRAEARRQERERLEEKARRADTLDNERTSILFSSFETLREAHQRDIDDLRNRLTESERMRESQGARIGELERRVTEFEAGLRVAVGFVLIPAPLWQQIRERLPDLPVTRFPGERVVEASPGDTGGPQ